MIYITYNANICNIIIEIFFNIINRFECRWSAVKISENTNKSDTWFRGMGGSVLGVWVAHGEGRFTTSESYLLEKLQGNKQIAMQYVDDDGEPTEVYPMNPNGSSRE